MSATTFDTLMYAKKLKEAGFSERQAEIQAEALKEVIDNSLATKQDIIELKREIKDVENNLKRDIKEAMDRIIIRLGSLLVIAVGVLAAIIKL
jgi:predicted phage-related endonuclease